MEVNVAFSLFFGVKKNMFEKFIMKRMIKKLEKLVNEMESMELVSFSSIAKILREKGQEDLISRDLLEEGLKVEAELNEAVKKLATIYKRLITEVKGYA